MIIGFYFSTYSKAVIIGGILIIAVSDSMSDALGMHISEEFNGRSARDVWIATGSTFFFKFVFAIVFVVWFFLFDVRNAVIFSVIWGALLMILFSYYLAKSQKVSALRVVFEHIFIMALVMIITYFVGVFIGNVFV